MRQRLSSGLFILLALIMLCSGCKKENKTPAPVADFSYVVENVPAPAEVTFTNSSSNAAGYSWDFGDNATSTEANPHHTYVTGGTFTVKLKATGDGGINSVEKTVIIQSENGPVADFTFSGSGSRSPCVIDFTSTSLNATSWAWDFGDGQTSAEQNPEHIYTSGGDFNVQLTVTNVNGSNKMTKSVQILSPPSECKISKISIITCPLVDNTGAAWAFHFLHRIFI